MTHRDLVMISYKWLLKNGGVGVAFYELKSSADEIPDVIGFDSWQSTLIECKISRSDFISDKNKSHRLKGMGNWRFYCCPKGLIKKEELPDKWGLIYVNEKGKAKVEYDCRVKKVKQECHNEYLLKEHPEGFYWVLQTASENWFEADIVSEKRIMYTALRRLFIKGYVKFIYDKEYKRDSTAQELFDLNI